MILSKQGQCFLNIIQVWVLIEGGLGYIITVFLQERYNEMPTTCNVDSLDSTHNSPQAFVQGVRDARMRISAQFRGWWCTCSAQVHVSILCSWLLNCNFCLSFSNQNLLGKLRKPRMPELFLEMLLSVKEQTMQ